MKLKGVPFWELLLTRIKKMILDMTSVKFESMVFVAWCIWAGKVGDIAGLCYLATCLGIREFIDLAEKGAIKK